MKIVSKSLSETEEIAKNFLDTQNLSTSSRQSAQIVGLVGDLGAGKTAFVQAVAKLLGIKESVTSPTFVIMKIYDLGSPVTTAVSRLRLGQAPRSGLETAVVTGLPPFKKLIHIDAYRLQNGEELMKLNFAELAAASENLILIEWPENVSSALPVDYQKVYFKFIDENTREISQKR